MSGKRIVEGATTYVVIETQCEHGFVGPGDIYDGHRYTGCPGGSRRTLTEGQYVLIEKVDGEWPAIDVDGHFVVGPLMLQTIALALSDHTEGTP